MLLAGLLHAGVMHAGGVLTRCTLRERGTP
jgi:hypothetical protein